MSTVTSSSPPGYVPPATRLEDCSLDQLVSELTYRLLGPEKAKLLKGCGVDVGALCQALLKTTSTPSTPTSVLKKEDSGTSTLPQTLGGLELLLDLSKSSQAQRYASISQGSQGVSAKYGTYLW